MCACEGEQESKDYLLWKWALPGSLHRKGSSQSFAVPAGAFPWIMGFSRVINTWRGCPAPLRYLLLQGSAQPLPSEITYSWTSWQRQGQGPAPGWKSKPWAGERGRVTEHLWGDSFVPTLAMAGGSQAVCKEWFQNVQLLGSSQMQQLISLPSQEL